MEDVVIGYSTVFELEVVPTDSDPELVKVELQGSEQAVDFIKRRIFGMLGSRTESD